MMSLTSGLPGAGKTLWTIAHVEALRKKEGREVYYHGIKDLSLPWHEMADPTRWFECPPGSIIVIDEAQRWFPLRGPSAAKPEHVDKTATHRHDGFDIFLITQHPGKIDASVRKDIEVHRHLMRKFGSNWATVHQWQGVRENCDKTRKDSISTTWRYPKEVFTWYKSAEVHTHKLKIPPAVIAAVLVLILIGAAWAHFIGRLSSQASGALSTEEAPASTTGTAARPVSAGQGSGDKAAPKTAAEYVAERVPRVEGLQHTAPVYDGLTAPKVVPIPAACIQWAGKGCKCFTQTGTPYATTEAICVQIVKNGVFLDFDHQPAPQVSRASLSSSGDNTGPQRAD